MNFKSTNATHLLLFYETCINTDLQTVSLEYTLEHIYCQKDKANLSNQSLEIKKWICKIKQHITQRMRQWQ